MALANNNRLCVKGRFGYDYAMSKERLTKPLIRRDDAPKQADIDMRFMEVSDVFREATWEEALDRAANGLKNIHKKRGGDALAGFGSAKGSNEEAYLFQKFIRQGFWHQQCGSLHTALPCVFRIRPVGRGGFWRSFCALHRCPESGLCNCNWLPTNNQPPCGCDLFQAGR